MTIQNDTRTLFIGGASGMSKAAARLMLEAGGAVVLLGRQRAKLEQAREELTPLGRVFQGSGTARQSAGSSVL